MFLKNSQITLITFAIVALAAQNALCAPLLPFREYEQQMIDKSVEETSKLHSQIDILLSQASYEYSLKKAEILS